MSQSHAVISEALLLLGAAVVSAPLFKRLGLGTVLGYLAAGVLIGPVLNHITDGEEILSFAELGVVFLLFIIGLELKPTRLWQMRRDIFGLGSAQVLISGAILSSLVHWAGLLGWQGAIVAGFGLALSSTAFALQILEERSDLNTAHGQRAFSILLFQDIAIVPLLALTSFIAPDSGESFTWTGAAIAIGAVAALILAGRYLLTPLFQIIGRTGAREAMIAAALFVVLGAGALMEMAGLSMAMGAFLAGLMLAESSFRHELEADIEPFRGILLGLFFMAVGLSLDLKVVLDNWLIILISVPVIMSVKTATIYALCRIGRSSYNDSAKIGFLLSQGGEFGFVLFTTAAGAAVFPQSSASLLIAIVTVTMALTPLVAALPKLLPKGERREELEEDFEGAGAEVFIVGFSRFAQIAAQILLAAGREVTIIDHSADRIRQASRFGFRIYFGDGTRKDVLVSAGIAKAKIIAICTHNRELTDRIVDLVQSEYPDAKIFVRSYDRGHSLSLLAKGVDYELRETLESGLLFGQKTLEALGMTEADASAIKDDIRKRDEMRLAIQAQDGISAGREMLYSNQPVQPEPLIKPRQEAAE
ncbi:MULTISPECIES: monovalent cation:proton antiporter-2 (CPA2) family protein [unclassified Rhizobium]|uniref:monovalent cation:proton antiporter-2 (CPA2) family protein n=1 Tax=unclassified Rhizobium TaxID=2613769 RepID=UPI001602EDF4|nr:MULTISPECIES: monovalent cation:proton antiporter-2 (CPA2) family protein [unclassified Rhizobium]MBB1248890.1 cation:proton antiporter [Rhizobium sp. G21]MCV3766813.1 monovalent cation:proton antiporter-2 (CPA2) family protein [Rhizobium sp. TRM95796]